MADIVFGKLSCDFWELRPLPIRVSCFEKAYEATFIFVSDIWLVL